MDFTQFIFSEAARLQEMTQEVSDDSYCNFLGYDSSKHFCGGRNHHGPWTQSTCRGDSGEEINLILRLKFGITSSIF